MKGQTQDFKMCSNAHFERLNSQHMTHLRPEGYAPSRLGLGAERANSPAYARVSTLIDVILRSTPGGSEPAVPLTKKKVKDILSALNRTDDYKNARTAVSDVLKEWELKYEEHAHLTEADDMNRTNIKRIIDSVNALQTGVSDTLELYSTLSKHSGPAELQELTHSLYDWRLQAEIMYNSLELWSTLEEATPAETPVAFRVRERLHKRSLREQANQLAEQERVQVRLIRVGGKPAHHPRVQPHFLFVFLQPHSRTAAPHSQWHIFCDA